MIDGYRFGAIIDVQLRTSEHRSMYSYVRLSIDRVHYVRLSIDRCTATTSEHRSSEHRSMYSYYV